MASHRCNSKGIKVYRNYSVDEAARTLHVAEGTVRRWIKAGLPTVVGVRPQLILGPSLINFLADRRPRKQKCKLHECYCLGCRTVRAPAFNAVEYHPASDTSGNLRALCAHCSGIMRKRFPKRSLDALGAHVEVTITQVDEHLTDAKHTSPNVHF